MAANYLSRFARGLRPYFVHIFLLLFISFNVCHIFYLSQKNNYNGKNPGIPEIDSQLNLALKISSANTDTTFVSVLSPAVEITGRTVLQTTTTADKTETASVMYDWPCVSVTFTVQNTTMVNVLLDGGYNSFRVLVDVVEFSETSKRVSDFRLETKKGTRSYQIAKNLAPMNKYKITVVKITESGIEVIMSLKPVVFVGFYVSNMASPVRPAASPEKPKIEVFGDSDSNGFMINSKHCFTALAHTKAFEDCYDGIASRVSRNLGADLHLEAWSGKGIIKNAAGIFSGKEVMPKYWGRSIAKFSDKYFWDFKSWKPDLVVVFLGSNDYTSNFFPPTDPVFQAGYLALLEKIYESYVDPQTGHSPMILSICGGLNKEAHEPCPNIQAVVEKIKQEKSEKSKFFSFFQIPTDFLTKNEYACLDHRNNAGQQKVSEFLSAHIANLMNWKSV